MSFNKENMIAVAGVLATIMVGGLAWLQNRSFHTNPPPEFGNCHLRVKEIPSLTRINDNIKEGIADVTTSRTDLAVRRFNTILAVDPNFLSAQLNLGSALLEQGKLDDAEKAFDAEMTTIDCLRSTKEDLTKFWYLVDPANKSANLNNQDKTTFLQTKIQKDEDTVHYNRAGLKIKQKDNDQALEQLKLAVQHNFIPRQVLVDDPALKSLKDLPGFKSLVKGGS